MLFRFINTIRFLKFRQIFYQLFFRIKFLIPNRNIVAKIYDFKKFDFSNFLIHKKSYYSKNTFEFLGKRKVFDAEIDWNFMGHGVLWNYNLNYFDFLNQEKINQNEIDQILLSFKKNYKTNIYGNQAYPTSLRIMNLMKYMSKFNCYEKYISIVKNDVSRLINNIEYHIDGNHLFENAFALYFASFLFPEKSYKKKSSKLLRSCLNEQILDDGGHYELSPMYHKLMLYRILDCINLAKSNSSFDYDKEIISIMRLKAAKMCSWLKEITLNNGMNPNVNDSLNSISHGSQDILEYAKFLNIEINFSPLNESGYRLIKFSNYELFIDAANVKASYQPGHSHADTFNFELYIKNKPIIVDTGISTYENNQQRRYERSTSAHNTVVVNDKNSSDVWSSFRLGNRANVKIINESDGCFEASHDGYRKLDASHVRKWKYNENEIVITDKILSDKITSNNAYIHFHPDIIYKIEGNVVILDSICLIKFENFLDISEFYSTHSSNYNSIISSASLKINFLNKLKTSITII